MKTKKNIKIRRLMLLVLTLTVFSCNKFDDLNTDPTRSSNISPENQLVFSQLWFSGDLGTQERTNAIILMPLVQHFGGAYYTRVGGAYINTIQENRLLWVLWENSYQNDVVNIVDAVERTNGDATRKNLNAMCRIMKVYTFARLTDIYGDIPYSEAAKGYLSKIVRPKYDRQEEIYNDFLKELKEASAQLSSEAGTDKVPSEIFYQGNITSWKKFANSLRIRLAMRLVKRNPDRAKIEVEEAYNAEGGVFTSNSDICMTRHLDIQNDYADLRGNSASVAINQQTATVKIVSTFLNQLKNTNDPRLNVIPRCYRQNNPLRPFEREDITAQVRASVVGLVGSGPGRFTYEDWAGPVSITLADGSAYSAVNGDIKAELNNCFMRNNAPFLHLTYAEVEFLLADATVRLGVNLGGDAATHYAKGVEAAIQQLSLFPGAPAVTPAEISTFITANPLEVGEELRQINTQLWIALMLNGPEAFSNWRRSGYPELVAAPRVNESTSLTIPRRLEYPLSEKEQNAENVQEAINIIGGDDWAKRVWWDKE